MFFPPPPQYLFESSTEPAGPDEQKETLVLVWVGAIAVEFVCCSEFAMIVVGLIVCLVEVCLGVRLSKVVGKNKQKLARGVNQREMCGVIIFHAP